MPNGWTSALESVSLSNFVKIGLKNRSYTDLVDSIAEAPISMLISNPSFAKLLDLASVTHDLYMGAACNTYADYINYDLNWEDEEDDEDDDDDESDDDSTVKKPKPGDKLPVANLMLGNIIYSLRTNTGKVTRQEIPVIIAPASKATLKNGGYAISGTKGLYASSKFIVVNGISSADISATLMHEFIHSLVGSLPELKDSMYGENQAIQAEEIVTHLVTDHFSKIQSLTNVNFVMSSISIPCKKSGKAKEFQQFFVEDIIVEGKSLVKSQHTIDASSKDVKDYIKTKKEVYAL